MGRNVSTKARKRIQRRKAASAPTPHYARRKPKQKVTHPSW